MADVGKKLIVRPTLAGFGVVVADCVPEVSLSYYVGHGGRYEGCVVVDVGAEYASAYTCEVGSTIAYTVCEYGIHSIKYVSVDPGTHSERWNALAHKLIVRPTLAGFGVVVADCATCDPNLDYVGCVVVDLTQEYAYAYKYDVGSAIAYSTYKLAHGKIRYVTTDPGTGGT